MRLLINSGVSTNLLLLVAELKALSPKKEGKRLLSQARESKSFMKNLYFGKSLNPKVAIILIIMSLIGRRNLKEALVYQDKRAIRALNGCFQILI